jgi:crotonobetainyl-CoA:carnitine CoA-transferase CaiB-like acyl-CoA transferase
VGDLSGGLNLASGVVGALFKRERTGRGLQVDVSLYHTGMWIMAQSIGAAPLGLAPRARSDARLSPRNPLVNSYRTKDHRWLVLCLLQPDKDWPDFCRHVERPEWIDDERFCDIDAREKNSALLVSMLGTVFAQRDLEEWRRHLATMKGVWAPALTAEEIAVDPQVEANDYFAEVHALDGSTFRSVASPVQFGGETIGPLQAMPEHAQQTEEVLLEAGWSWEDLTRLKDAGAIS